jgi:hypothetical protein
VRAGLDRAAAAAEAAAVVQVAPAQVAEQPEEPEYLGQVVPQASPAPAAVAERAGAAEQAVLPLAARVEMGLPQLALETIFQSTIRRLSRPPRLA